MQRRLQFGFAMVMALLLSAAACQASVCDQLCAVCTHGSKTVVARQVMEMPHCAGMAHASPETGYALTAGSCPMKMHPPLAIARTDPPAAYGLAGPASLAASSLPLPVLAGSRERKFTAPPGASSPRVVALRV